MSDDVAGHGPAYRVPRHGGMDPATRRLALIAAGLGGGLFVVIGAWSTLGHHGGSVPVISPPAGPVRVKPENPGGMKLSSDMTIFGDGAGDQGAGKLAPAPEQPDPQALKPPAPPPAPISAPAPSPEAMTPPAEAAPAPHPAPIAKAVALPPLRPPAEAHPAATEPAPPPQPAAAAGRIQVQLAALQSREQAEAEWKLLAHRAPALLGNRAPSISEASVNGRSWWRVRTGGFADEAQARSFCDQLRAVGVTACSVARF